MWRFILSIKKQKDIGAKWAWDARLSKRNHPGKVLHCFSEVRFPVLFGGQAIERHPRLRGSRTDLPRNSFCGQTWAPGKTLSVFTWSLEKRTLQNVGKWPHILQVLQDSKIENYLDPWEHLAKTILPVLKRKCGIKQPSQLQANESIFLRFNIDDRGPSGHNSRKQSQGTTGGRPRSHRRRW